MHLGDLRGHFSRACRTSAFTPVATLGSEGDADLEMGWNSPGRIILKCGKDQEYDVKVSDEIGYRVAEPIRS